MMYADYYKGSDKEQFLAKVAQIASMLGVTADELMAMFYIESAVNPAAVNKYTGATGLIQFMPATAKALGTTVDALRQMSGTDQLDYVYEYLKIYRGQLSNVYDLYFAIFFPLAIGKPDNWILQTNRLPASIIAKQNAGYDLDNSGSITVGEVKAAIDKRLSRAEKKKPVQVR